jgi:two-component system chemotaxis response regulator CheB
MSTKARVLVVDDSVVARRVIADILEDEKDFLDVVGTAANGRIALAKIPLLKPDVITLDVDMPELNGLEVLKAVRNEHPEIKVIMVSSLTERGAKVTVDSLIMGASDYVTKAARSESAAHARQYLKDQLIPKVKALIPRPRRGIQVRKPLAVKAPVRKPVAKVSQKPIEVVVIGASTGGPNALAEMLGPIPSRFEVPVIIVQHMPENFTEYLAKRLNSKSPLTVEEAKDGLELKAGRAYVAPGNHHLEVERDDERYYLKTSRGPLVNSCRPSVDVLFKSVARVYGGAALAVVLTGMGQDGLTGCRQIAAVGGSVVVQDQATSVVWGMPGNVAEAEIADAILPIDEIGAEIVERVRKSER